MSVTKTESEKVVGTDEHGVAIVECPDVKPYAGGQFGKFWFVCGECGMDCFHDENGKTYFHLLKCSQSNLVGYGSERKNTTLPHSESCSCYTCKPPKGAPDKQTQKETKK
jgi:hypothetical protein